MARAHGSVDAGMRQQKSEDFAGDPTERDAEADNATPADARKRSALDRHGEGVRPVEGTSASNLPSTPGGTTCGNPYVGYGRCAGEIDATTGRCKSCGMPTRAEFQPLQGFIPANADGGQVAAHELEAARRSITTRVVAEVAREHERDLELSPDTATLSPKQKREAAAFQAEVDRRCQAEFMRAGLLPRLSVA